MLEAIRTELVQCALPCVAKGRVAQVMRQADGLGQVFVQAQGAGDGAGDLRHLQRVGQPGAVEVALRREEDLRFLLEAAERLAVDHAVPVALEHRADGVLRLRSGPAPACIAEGRPGGKGQPLDLFGTLAYIHPVSLTFMLVPAPFPAQLRPQLL